MALVQTRPRISITLPDGQQVQGMVTGFSDTDFRPGDESWHGEAITQSVTIELSGSDSEKLVRQLFQESWPMLPMKIR